MWLVASLGVVWLVDSLGVVWLVASLGVVWLVDLLYVVWLVASIGVVYLIDSLSVVWLVDSLGVVRLVDFLDSVWVVELLVIVRLARCCSWLTLLVLCGCLNCRHLSAHSPRQKSSMQMKRVFSILFYTPEDGGWGVGGGVEVELLFLVTATKFVCLV